MDRRPIALILILLSGLTIGCSSVDLEAERQAVRASSGNEAMIRHKEDDGRWKVMVNIGNLDLSPDTREGRRYEPVRSPPYPFSA